MICFLRSLLPKPLRAFDSCGTAGAVRIVDPDTCLSLLRNGRCQQEYYDAIAACHSSGNSNVFIEFMLDKINLTPDWALEQVSGKDACLPETVKRLPDFMEYDVPCKGAQLMRKLQLKSRENFRKLYLVPALERSLIIMSVPDKPTSRNQSYIRK